MAHRTLDLRRPLTLAPLVLGGHLFATSPALAHHGVAGAGTAGLEGPGAPVEAATSSVLPPGRPFLYLKLDRPDFERNTPEDDGESKYAEYWIGGFGYGVTSWLSLYAFLPYNVKVDEPSGFSTDGFADMSILGQLGFKYDNGFKLTPANESLDDLEDWHFTVLAGMTLPTGDPNLRASDGTIDPGKSTGFGKPAYSIGFTATKEFVRRWTLNLELGYLYFQPYTYDDGNTTQFGAEQRVNLALNYRALTIPDKKLRLDGIIELQYLGLGRDRLNGVGELATGGKIFYVQPGVRLYWNNLSVALGIKFPFATQLNEAADQQGAEGTENYRLIFTASYLW